MTNPPLSTANKITIAVVAAGVISSFSVTQYQVGVLDRRLEEMNSASSERVARFEAVAKSYESRIRAVEISHASQTSDLRNIQIGINEIKDQIRRLSESAR